MKWFLNSNSKWARALRTAVEGLMGTLIMWAADEGGWDWRYILATVVPVVVSPLMAALGSTSGGLNDGNLENNWEDEE